MPSGAEEKDWDPEFPLLCSHPTFAEAGRAEYAGAQGEHNSDEPGRCGGPDASSDNPA